MSEGVLESVTTFKRWDSPQGGLKVVTKVCQLMEMCVAHGRNVWELGEV